MRPTLIVAEPEPSEALSIRKLVLETAKFNVITAHSTKESMEVFHHFPNVAGIVLVMGEPIDCEAIAKGVKAISEKVPIVAVVARVAQMCPLADHHVPSHDPEALLGMVRSLFGDPRSIDTPHGDLDLPKH